MKLRRRSGRASAQWVLSVRAKDIEKLEDAATYLERRYGELSPFVVELVINTAKRRGWKPAPDIEMRKFADKDQANEGSVDENASEGV